jgi:AbrB family looped-hinge helix DNA binding protein
MASAGEIRVSQRGQMSLPASARHRWGLDGGGNVSFIDVGDAVVLIPEGVAEVRHRLIESPSESDWEEARRGFGDPDLVSE